MVARAPHALTPSAIEAPALVADVSFLVRVRSGDCVKQKGCGCRRSRVLRERVSSSRVQDQCYRTVLFLYLSGNHTKGSLRKSRREVDTKIRIFHDRIRTHYLAPTNKSKGLRGTIHASWILFRRTHASDNASSVNFLEPSTIATWRRSRSGDACGNRRFRPYS